MKITILLGVLAVLTWNTAFPCSCGPKPSVPNALAEAKAVFAGRCISGKLVTQHFKDGGSVERCEFTFEITRTWKGITDKKQITVETGLGWGDCGYPFQFGAPYIVYCREEFGTLSTNICTRTSCIMDQNATVEAELKQLDGTVKPNTK